MRRPPVVSLVPGLALCLGVTALASLLQAGEQRLFGQPFLEALVLAILLGVGIRTLWEPGARWAPGIHVASKILLEIAVVLLGASISVQTVASIGPAMLVGIAATVAVALAAGYGIGRVLGLPQRMAILIACGNAICGNSAIAAVAPIIGAESDDVASSIAFTAVLGVLVVLGLPLLAPVLGFSIAQYGALAGLTVYAVPQVLAATLPIGALANQVGTVVKLVRVLMLGPTVLCISLVAGKLRVGGRATGPARRPKLHEVLPWFILAFLAVAALRSVGIVPVVMLGPIKAVASLLTTISMAALGLGVDVRVVARAGVQVTAAVTFSLLVLGVIAVVLIRAVGE
jgi:uncharacterized integral membrane protein (TIGR00698 family)